MTPSKAFLPPVLDLQHIGVAWSAAETNRGQIFMALP